MQNVCTRALCAKVTVQLSEVTMIFAVMKINLSRQSRSSIKKTRSFLSARNYPFIYRYDLILPMP